MQKYQSKIVTVEAMKLEAETKDRVFTWASQIGNVYPDFDAQGNPALMIETPEGDMKCCLGDYVVKEPFPTQTRRLYPVKAEVFEARYVQVDNLGNETQLSKQQVSAAVANILERIRVARIEVLEHSWKVEDNIADDEHIVVGTHPEQDGYFLRVVGILNGVLNLLECPRVACLYTENAYTDSMQEIVVLKPKKDV